jgi:hypothetical protein
LATAHVEQAGHTGRTAKTGEERREKVYVETGVRSATVAVVVIVHGGVISDRCVQATPFAEGESDESSCEVKTNPPQTSSTPSGCPPVLVKEAIEGLAVTGRSADDSQTVIRWDPRRHRLRRRQFFVGCCGAKSCSSPASIAAGARFDGSHDLTAMFRLGVVTEVASPSGRAGRRHRFDVRAWSMIRANAFEIRCGHDTIESEGLAVEFSSPSLQDSPSSPGHFHAKQRLSTTAAGRVQVASAYIKFERCLPILRAKRRTLHGVGP